MDKLALQFKLRRRGFTQADIARMARVSEAAVSMILSGKTTSRRIEALIAGLLGERAEDIFPIPCAQHYHHNAGSATAKTGDLLPREGV